jgi:cytochrome c oxidase assembly protein Cox11
MKRGIEPGRRRRKWTTLAALGVVLAAMTTLVAFSVPIYRAFCAATGYNGTTQRATEASAKVSDRTVTVRFATDVAPGLPWRFVPLQGPVKVKLGEEKLVFFRAQNLTGKPIVGHAAFNVTPAQAGLYFNKIQCFCFTEERLAGGASADMPVDFYVDPKFATDPDTKDIDTITLAYTFFRSVDPAGAKNLSRFTASPKPDPHRGAALFVESCATCHDFDRNKVGPRLGGVVGRTAGTAAGYDYSPALRHSGIRWSKETLNRWLAGPQRMVPGVKMPVHVEDATMRRDIIAYLATRSRTASGASIAKTRTAATAAQPAPRRRAE